MGRRTVALGWCVFLSLLFLSGCRDRGPVKPIASAEPVEPVDPKGSAPDRRSFATRNGAIIVPLPMKEGWVWKERYERVMMGPITRVVCRRKRPDEDFFLEARVHRTPGLGIVSVRDLARRIFLRHQKRRHPRCKVTRESQVRHQGHEAYEIDLLTGVTPARAATSVAATKGTTVAKSIRIIERVVKHGHCVAVLHAEGDPMAFQTWARALGAWFARTRFEGLPTKRKGR